MFYLLIQNPMFVKGYEFYLLIQNPYNSKLPGLSGEYEFYLATFDFVRIQLVQILSPSYFCKFTFCVRRVLFLA